MEPTLIKLMAKPSELRLEILGGIRLFRMGELVKLRTRRTEDLLAFLAIHPGWHRRETVAALMWEHDEPSVARQKLRMALASIRAVVGGALKSASDQISVSGIEVDSEILFEQDIGYEVTPEPLMHLSDEWAMAYRDQFASRLAAQMIEHAASLEKSGEYSKAVRCRFRIFELDPLNVHNQVRLLKGLRRLGRTHEMRRYLNQLSPIPAELVEFLDTEGELEYTNFPCNTFIGREVELEQICAELLGDHEPAYLTIIGAPGIGKTRLAKEVARRASAASVASVFCPLITCKSMDEVVFAVSLALFGVADALDYASLSERIVTLPPTLLILDNVEHLNETAMDSLLQALEADGSSLRILITSQVVLKGREQCVVKLGPLGAPASATGFRPQDRLFAARAQMYLPSDGPSTEQRQLIRTICDQLEAIPLAIEVTAASLRYSSLHQLAQGLAHSSSRSPSSRTMKSAVDWSVSLLSAQLLRTLEAASVFADTFSVEMLSSVLGRDCSDDIETLLDRSLIDRDNESEAVRYRLLRPIQDALKVRQSKALTSKVAVDLAHRVVELSNDPSPANRCALVPDLASIDKATEVLLGKQEFVLLADMSPGLAVLWSGIRPSPFGEPTLETVYDQLPNDDRVRRAKVANALGHLAYFRAKHGLAQSWWHTRMANIELEGHANLLASAYCNIGLADLELGEWEAAIRHFMIALDEFERSGTPRQRATCCINLSGVHLALGNLASALDFARQSLDIAIENDGLQAWVHLACHRQSEIYFAQESFDVAASWAKRASEVLTAIKEPLRQVESLHRWHMSACLSGHAERTNDILQQLYVALRVRPFGGAMDFACRSAAAAFCELDDSEHALQALAAAARIRAQGSMLRYPMVFQREQRFFDKKLGTSFETHADYLIGQTLNLKECLHLVEMAASRTA